MNINIPDIEWVAKLARLSLSQKEKEHYAETLSVIFGYVEILNEVDTADVPETNTVGGITDRTRQDNARKTGESEPTELVKQFTDSEAGLLRVPAVFKQS